MKTNMSIDPSTSSTNIQANLNIDGSEVAVAYGSLNDSTSSNPLNLALNLNRFPLRKISAFIPGRMVMLTGHANGEMTVNGTMDNPIVNGVLMGDSAFIRLPRYGSSLRLSEEPIKVNNNTIDFVNYKIYGLNDNPALLNGVVDFKSLDVIKINAAITGKNIQFFGSEQRPYSEIFGKGFIDIDGTFKMNNNITSINADAKLLSGSNITYVMQDEITTIANNNAIKGMVTFINPYDSISNANQDIITGGVASSAMTMQVNADIEKGAKQTDDYSRDEEHHQDKVVVGIDL